MINTLQSLVGQKVRASLDEAGLLGTPLGSAAASGPVFLYGGGRHTWWLARAIEAFREREVHVMAVVDDVVRGQVGPWACMSAADAIGRFGPPRAVIMSTDTHQTAFAARVAEHFGPETVIVDLYKGLPPGPYAKAMSMEVAVTGVAIETPTRVCLSRRGSAIAPYLINNGLKRAMLIGQPWQTEAVAEGLRSCKVAASAGGQESIQIADNVREADCAIVCAAELEALGHAAAVVPCLGLNGPVLNLHSGSRPWFDRSASGRQGQVSADRVKIVLRHDHNLGDVILSQGIIPERIKTELYPNAHITFVTSSRAWNRPGSDNTGWAMDAIAANPWIDEVRDAESFGQHSWTSGCDLAYRINGSGSVYDHVFDYHAMHAELAPGRTDAKLHLFDGDRELARQVVSAIKNGRRGPVIAVNMALAANRARGWGEMKTTDLCQRLERELQAVIVWMGWVDFGPYKRLVDVRASSAGRPLSVREQAAVMGACDLHITCQGGGANMSAAVGCQTLALSGLHPAHREGVAYFNNQYIEDSSRWHVELYRYATPGGDERDELRVLNYGTRRDVPWRVDATLQDSVRESDAALDRYHDELWNMTTPVDKLPETERYWWRTRDLTVDDVYTTAGQMLEARRKGRTAPGV